MAKKQGKGAIGAEFNQALADEIIDRLLKLQPIDTICKEDHMPKVRALQRWAEENPEWGKRFREAKRAFRKKVRQPVTQEVVEKTIGRPSVYTEELANKVLSLAGRGVLLPDICDMDGMPCRMTIWRWEQQVEGFSEALVRARQFGAEYMARDVIAISDDQSNDWTWREGRNGEEYEAFDHEHVQRSRLRCDSRKWYLSCTDERFRDKTNNQQVLVSTQVNTQAQSEDQSTAVDAYAAFQRLVKGE